MATNLTYRAPGNFNDKQTTTNNKEGVIYLIFYEPLVLSESIRRPLHRYWAYLIVTLEFQPKIGLKFYIG